MHFLHLPTELLLDIFIKLDYLTLKLSISPLCRRFRAIIEEPNSPLDELLFRDLTILTEEQCTVLRVRTRHHDVMYFEPSPYTIHPIFAFLCLRVPVAERFEGRNIGFRTASGEFVSLLNTTIASEAATYPATSTAFNVTFGVGSSVVNGVDSVLIKNEVDEPGSAITVRDVLLSLEAYTEIYQVSWKAADPRWQVFKSVLEYQQGDEERLYGQGRIFRWKGAVVFFIRLEQ